MTKREQYLAAIAAIRAIQTEQHTAIEEYSQLDDVMYRLEDMKDDNAPA